MNIRAGARRVAAVGLLLACSGLAHAIAPLHEDSVQANAPLPAWRPGNEPSLTVLPSLAPNAERSPLLRDRVQPFQQRFGGAWEMRWDVRADRPNVVEGSGIPLLPGRGNGLVARANVDLAYVAGEVRGLFARMPELLRLDKIDLRLDETRSGAFGPSSTFWFVELQQYHEGVPVDGAFAYARISHGNVVQFGTERVAEITASATPRQSREAAFDLAWEQLDFADGVAVGEIVDEGALRFYPVLPPGEAVGEAYSGLKGYGYDHRLAWRFVFRVAGGDATYEVLFDSAAQRILAVNNLTVNADATVTGGVYPTTNTDTELVLPLPFVAVTNGGNKVTDADGVYDYSGGSASSTLNGRYFRMDDQCGAISLTNSTDGNLAFGTSGGTDCVTPGIGGAGNTHASRTGHHHLSRINEKARAILPTNTWLQSTVTSVMNIVDVCNAGWNGSQVRFFRSGSGCSNTGEIAAVFLHEWGHGMDSNSGGAANENGSGEAVGDTFAFLETQDACIGPNFRPGVPCANCGTCTGVRDVEVFSTRGNRTIARPDTLADDNGINCDRYACPYLQQGIFPYQGPMGFQGHCESHIASGSTWDLTQNLVDHYGEEGWQRMDDIWYSSLVPSKSAYRITSGGQCNVNAQIDGCGATNWYTVFLAVNDDDGNLANGTPDACRIFDAFDAHGIACGVRPECSADDPNFTLAVNDSPQRVCAGETATFGIAVGAQLGFSADVTLALAGAPPAATSAFSPNPVEPGNTASLQIVTDAGTAAGNYPLTISGTAAGSDGRDVAASLFVDTQAPAAPTLTAPAHRAALSGTGGTFTWTAVADAMTYRIEVSRDAMFTDIVHTQDVASPTATVGNLDAASRYYWRVTALNSCGDGVASAVFSFATSANVTLACNTTPLPIPDNNATGATNSVTVSETGQVSGLQLQITATHTYIGDLAFTLTHEATSVVAIDRPGVPGSANGCNRGNIDVLLDDAAATAAEAQCSTTPPALGGTQRPNNPLDAGFAGHALAGMWSLRATDAAAQDTGTVQSWCLIDKRPAAAAYSVGGTVSGLLGDGLVLSLNDGEELIEVAADGSYAFLTLIDSGAAYSVSVQTQPSTPDQVCNVANASGSIGNADVANVDVVCADATFTLGGTVTGLLGSGLVLELAGGETLDIAADGAFVFATALDDGVGYDVIVANQPTDPSQTCTIDNAVGTVAGADVTDLAVTCVTDTFTIGGTVTGLEGTGLVLRLDGDATLAVSTDGAFEFAMALEDGAAYVVDVATQPSEPPQRCTVVDGEGTVAGADVTDIAVTCVTLPIEIFDDGFEAQ